MRDPLLELRLLDRPVRSLQQMLRTIHFADESIPLIAPNGIFDPPTERALRSFQRREGLAVTGEADSGTWAALAATYDQALELLAPAVPLRMIVQRGQPLSALHQLMFDAGIEALRSVLDVPADGVRWLQNRAALPETGVADRATWDALSRLYPAVLGDGS